MLAKSFTPLLFNFLTSLYSDYISISNVNCQLNFLIFVYKKKTHALPNTVKHGFSPYNFLKGKYNGVKPTTRDLNLIESLMIDLSLRPAVVNVLIDYVLKINNNKLTKNKE